MAVESIPPESSAPSGTSATISSPMVSDRRPSTAEINSSSEPVSGSRRPASTTSCRRQYGATEVFPPSSMEATWPGRSFEIPRKIESGAGT